MSKSKECEVCGEMRQIHLIDVRGWCTQCATEFEKVQQRERWTCVGQCNTPISCAIGKKCLKTPTETDACNGLKS